MNIADFKLAAKVAEGKKLTVTDLKKVSKPALRTVALELSERLSGLMSAASKAE